MWVYCGVILTDEGCDIIFIKNTIRIDCSGYQPQPKCTLFNRESSVYAILLLFYNATRIIGTPLGCDLPSVYKNNGW